MIISRDSGNAFEKLNTSYKTKNKNKLAIGGNFSNLGQSSYKQRRADTLLTGKRQHASPCLRLGKQQGGPRLPLLSNILFQGLAST